MRLMTTMAAPATASITAAQEPPAGTARSAFAIDVPAGMIARVQRGDRVAFEQLYRWFERPVYALAVRILDGAHGDGRDEAADVLQETMLKVYRRIGEFRGETSPFWGWLRQIAVNEALMRLRRHRRHGLDTVLEEGTDIEDCTPPPPAAADAARLQRALAELPPVTRSVLWLYHAEGYTHDEIGELMQRTASFSKSQLARGTRRLRDILGPNSTGPNLEVSDVR